jgi:phosphoglycolate phosphatase-like HAD superfamily hydrolase
MRTIVWDVDDVLNNLAEHWLRQWRAEHPAVSVDYASLSKNPPHELLSISFETYLKSLDLIRDSVDAHEQLTPNPQILEWLRQHGHRYRHLALTARPAHTVGPAAAWVLRHFGEWIRTVAFVPTRKPPAWPDYDLTKAGYLQWLNLDAILIDDSATNVMEVKAKGLDAMLFPQPWNPGAPSVPELLNQLAHF